MLKYDVLPRILLLLRPESNEPVGVRRRALFALSSLVRSHVEGQQALWSLGGLDVLKGLCSQSSPHHVPALCVKAVTLIYDLVVEEVSTISLALVFHPPIARDLFQTLQESVRQVSGGFGAQSASAKFANPKSAASWKDTMLYLLVSRVRFLCIVSQRL